MQKNEEMRKKLSKLAHIFGHSLIEAIGVVLGHDEAEQNTVEKPSDDELQSLIDVYCETLENTRQLFVSWEERGDDKYDEFLHHFFVIHDIIIEMQKHGMIVEADENNKTTITARITGARNDN